MEKLSMDALGRMSAEEFKAADKLPVMIVLDNVRSMHNVGSVFRSADAFLMKGICLCGFTPRPPHRDIHKTALGSTETVHWEYYDSTLQAVENLKEQGYKIVSVEQVAGSVPLPQFEWNGSEPLALVLGNEVEGVAQEIVDLSDACVEIPQMGTKHSLNISVAAGIVLYKIAELFSR